MTESDDESSDLSTSQSDQETVSDQNGNDSPRQKDSVESSDSSESTNSNPKRKTKFSARQASDERVEQRHYYRDVVHRIIPLMLALIMVTAIAVAVAGYALFRGPEIQNFAFNSNWRVQRLTPLTQPTLNASALRGWIRRNVRQIYSFNFLHHAQQFEKIKHLFVNRKAYRNFVKALKKANIITTVRRKRLVLGATLRKPPNIVGSKMINGRKTWKAQVPIMLRYESASNSRTQKLNLTVLVQRVSQAKRPDGLAFLAVQSGS